MGRHSCCLKQKLRKGLWSPEEDEKLFNYITRFGVGCWSSVPKLAGISSFYELFLCFFIWVCFKFDFYSVFSSGFASNRCFTLFFHLGLLRNRCFTLFFHVGLLQNRNLLCFLIWVCFKIDVLHCFFIWVCFKIEALLCCFRWVV